MTEKIRLGLCFLFLLTEGIYDRRKKRILLLPAAVFGVTGAVLSAFSGKRGILSALLGAGVGGILFLISFATKEKIGPGDGIVFVVTGLLLGFRRNLFLLLFSLFLSALAGIWLLLTRRAGRDTKMAFVPFLIPGLVLTTALLEGGVTL